MSFVLKMDECQIVKNKRLERMSITLMNESLAYAKCEPSLLIDDIHKKLVPNLVFNLRKSYGGLGHLRCQKRQMRFLLGFLIGFLGLLMS